MQHIPYIYEAKVLRWVDGDTVELDVKVGFYFTLGDDEDPPTFRLFGADAYEKRDELGPAATALSKELAPEGSKILIRTRKQANGKLKDNFGRYLASVYSVDGEDISQALISAGLTTGRYEDL